METKRRLREPETRYIIRTVTEIRKAMNQFKKNNQICPLRRCPDVDPRF